MDNTITLTKDMLHDAGTGGCGFNRHQLSVLGVPWPPRTGWLKDLVGTKVTVEQWNNFVQLRGRKSKRRIDTATPLLF